MNIRDSYIHGADGRGVVKSLFFATAADVQVNNALHVNDLVFLLADTLGTQVPLTIPTLNQNTSGYASSLLTVKSTSTSNHYLTFVDSNNTTAEAESFYTSGDIYFKPSTGVLTVKSVTVNNTFNYTGIGSDTTSNAARKIWFASSSDGTPVVSDNFKYNPSTKTLTVDKISGPTIVIGNTTLYLDGANNVLTPDTVINNTSTNNTIPSSKAVWDAILTGIQANDAMVFKGFLTGGVDAAHTAYTPGADRGDTYKVQTAGYINGEYYQVNDTFICTTDGTVAATSSNVSTVKANWGVVEGNGDYLNINGGTMYGTLSWDGTTALPTVTTASNILVVDDNVTKQISLASLLTSLNLAPSISNGTANNTVKITVGGVDSSDYTIPYASNADKLDNIDSSNFARQYNNHPTASESIQDGLVGGKLYNSPNWPKSYYAFISSGYSNYKMQFNAQSNILYFRAGDEQGLSNKTWCLIAHSGNIVNNNTTIDWNTETTIATIAGVAIKIKIPTNPNTNTWRDIYTTGTSRVGTGIDTKAMNFASSNLDITYLAAGTGTGKSGDDAYFTINLDAKNWVGATSESDGTAGYMPGASTANRLKFLRGDGTWISLSESDTKVTQNSKTDNKSYRILLKHTDNNTDETDTVNYSSNLTYNTSTKLLYNSGPISVGNGKFNNLINIINSVNANTLKSSYGLDSSWSPSSSNSTINFLKAWSKYIQTNYSGLVTYSHISPNSLGYILVHCYSSGFITLANIDSGGSFANAEVGNPVHLNGHYFDHGGNECIFGYAYGKWYNWNNLHSGNSSVSGGGSAPGDAITVTINTVSRTLTIPTIPSQSIEIFNSSRTLKVDSWMSIVDISSYTGTYAIQINSGTVYASGIFTACGGTDTVIDEIPLHVANSNTNTWRPYARVSGNNILMSTNETTGTSRNYKIRIIKLI